MHSFGQKNALKNWYGLPDLDIIKEVTSKGENVLLCKEFLANRHGLQISQYEMLFRNEIKKYIKQLLTEKQFTKAEYVIKNVNEDVECTLFECTFESTDLEFQKLILDYMEETYPKDFRKRKQLFEFYFHLLMELQLSSILNKWIEKIQPLNLENLSLLPLSDKQELLMDIYLERKCDFVLTYLEKKYVWQYIITTRNTFQMLTWLTCNQEPWSKSVYVGLIKKYQEWPLEKNMIRQAIQIFSNESDALVYCFGKYGCFLQEELNSTKALLKRLISNGILKDYMHLLSYEDILHMCLDKKYYMFGIYLCNECVNKKENHDLHLLCALRKFGAQNLTDWIYISQQALKHLERNGHFEDAILTQFGNLTQDVPAMHGEDEKLNFSIPNIQQLLYNIQKLDLNYNSEINMAVSSWKMCNLYEKYGKECKLIYLDFLKQYRSSSSIYKLFIDRLQQFFVFNQTHLYTACKNTFLLVANCKKNESMVIHSVAFLEMLGFDSQPLRMYLKLLKKLNIGDVPQNFKTLISLIDEQLKNMISESSFPLKEYGALLQIASYSNYKSCPVHVLRIYAQENNWWRFLILLHFYEIPCAHLNAFLEHFQSKQIRDNIRRCCFNHLPSSKIGKQYTSHLSLVTNKELNFIDLKKKNFMDCCEQKGVAQNPKIVDAFILISKVAYQKSQNNKIEICFENLGNIKENSTFSNILMNTLPLKCSFVYMLSTSVNVSDVEWIWATYLIVSTNQYGHTMSMGNLKKHEIFWSLMEITVKSGYVELLLKSFKIFFKDTFFIDLLEFLKQTQINKDFSDTAADYLRSYLIYWSNDELYIPLCKNISRNDIFLNTIKILLTHLEYNFDSALDTENFLDCVCKSSIDEMCDVINFSLLKKVFKIVQNEKKIGKTEIINFKSIILTKNIDFEKVLTLMKNQKMFDASIEIASLLLLPTCDIIYSKWIEELNKKETGVFEIEKYENELAEHSLPPEMLVNFFIHAASKFANGSVRKYELMKSGLEVIKKHHLFLNESFDRDQIEYDTILCFIQIEDTGVTSCVDIYHSEYYEQIMLKERCVLFKSFVELKELAGVEEIMTRLKEPLTQAMLDKLELLMNRLLNECDIVEALRVQELFEFRPIDLRFIVFCMALAEGVASILNLSAEDRQLLCDIEKGSFGLFNKRTLSTVQQNNQDKNSELSASNYSFEFEEWPPKDRNDTLKAILGIASKLKSGVKIGQRIALAYRAAMYLDKDYLDVLRTKDVGVLLKSITEEECFHCLLVVSDIIKSTNMTNQEIADFFGYEIATAVIRPRFYIFNTGNQSLNDFKSCLLWGYNIDRDLHLFLELIPNTKLLGSILLEYCDALKSYRKYQDKKTVVINSVFHKLTDIIAQYGLPSTFGLSKTNSSTPLQVLSHKKQNLIYVELLIKAHQCFLHECSMEGIANVLNRAKSLNSVLASAKSWSLIVKMLIGIGHYREMFYCFDTLVENEQFESLLGQFDDEKSRGLRQGILAYLREHKPENSKELFRLAALHFLMYKDLAEMMLDEAKLLHTKLIGLWHVLVEDETLGNNVKIPKLLCTDAVLELLHKLLDCYTQATENFLLDNKLLLAEKAMSASELTAMQIDIVKHEMNKQTTNPRCICVINIKSKLQFCTVLRTSLSIPQIIILSRYFNYDVNWSEVLLWKYVIQGNRYILGDFLENMDITDSIILNTVKGYQQFTKQNKSSTMMEEKLFNLVGLVKYSTTKYKLASILSMKSTILSLINEQNIYYLKDMNFGRKD